MALERDRVRAEIEIDAPIERVWGILTDLDRYEEWNPFTPRVDSTLEIGAPVHLTVRLVGDRLTRRVETVTRNAPYCLGWGMTMGAPFLLRAERTQALTALGPHRTRYVTEDRFSGWLRPVVLGLFGRAMERGFSDCARGLARAAERNDVDADEAREGVGR